MPYAGLLEEAITVAASERDRLLPYQVQGSLSAFSGSYREGIFDQLDARYYPANMVHDLKTTLRAVPAFCGAGRFDDGVLR